MPFVLFGANTSRLNVVKHRRRQLPPAEDCNGLDDDSKYNGLPTSHMVQTQLS